MVSPIASNDQPKKERMNERKKEPYAFYPKLSQMLLDITNQQKRRLHQIVIIIKVEATVNFISSWYIYTWWNGRHWSQNEKFAKIPRRKQVKCLTKITWLWKERRKQNVNPFAHISHSSSYSIDLKSFLRGFHLSLFYSPCNQLP